jgi:hypothetical protein
VTLAGLLLAIMSSVRLTEGAALIAAGVAFKRRFVLVYGVAVILLCIPTAAVSVGVHIPPGPLVIISAGHAISLACVLAVAISFAGEVRRLRSILAEAGLHQAPEGWRP